MAITLSQAQLRQMVGWEGYLNLIETNATANLLRTTPSKHQNVSLR
ncbi:MAG: hypothetical protein ACK4UU_02320 [Fimbriimonadales bacterium]